MRTLMADQLPLRFGARPVQDDQDWVAHVGVVEAAATLARWPDWPDGRLCLVGPAGSGKSVLARLWRRRTGAADGTETDLSGPATGPVLIEDADLRPADDALFHLFNRAAATGGSLLLTARTLPSLWPSQVPDLRSRLNALAVAQLSEPDDGGFADLLRAAFRSRQIRPSTGLLTFLARRVERSAAAAYEVAGRLDEAAMAAGKPVSRSFAQVLLGDQPDLFGEGAEDGPAG